jgi:2-polyprenyl-3-methyl-5-hydroxy-6-metoxy-1,4-benzoquinol methylase
MSDKQKMSKALELQAKHFDELAEKSDLNLYNNSPKYSQREIHNLILEAMRHKPNGEVLEIGAGKGLHTIFLLENGFKVTANDVSEGALRVLHSQAKKYNLDKQLKILHGDIISSSEKPNSYDFIFFADTFHHLEYEQTISILKSLHSLLRHDGRLIAWEPNGKYPFWKQMHLINPDFNWEYEKNILHCTKVDFLNKFKEANWQLEKYLNHRILPMGLLDQFPIFRWLDKQLIKIPLIRKISAYSLIVAKLD